MGSETQAACPAMRSLGHVLDCRCPTSRSDAYSCLGRAVRNTITACPTVRVESAHFIQKGDASSALIFLDEYMPINYILICAHIRHFLMTAYMSRNV